MWSILRRLQQDPSGKLLRLCRAKVATPKNDSVVGVSLCGSDALAMNRKIGPRLLGIAHYLRGERLQGLEALLSAKPA